LVDGGVIMTILNCSDNHFLVTSFEIFLKGVGGGRKGIIPVQIVFFQVFSGVQSVAMQELIQ